MKPPQIKIKRLKQVSDPKFIDIERYNYNISYPDGSSKEMVIDTIVRKHPNAVVILAYDLVNGTHIYLRSCLRPAVYNKFPKEGNRWELAAGLIEKESDSEAASRETKEELGFDVPSSNFEQLGKASFTATGLLCEQLIFMKVEVDPHKQSKPSHDGSPLEHCGIVWRASLFDIKKMLCNGELDLKSEVGIMRFLST